MTHEQLNLRWNQRRNAWRPNGELIDPSQHAVELIEEAEAKAFVTRHHYSASYPSSRLRVGLRRREGVGWKLAGVAVFSVPPSQAVFPKWTGGSNEDSVDLGRLVLLDEVEGNGESWFVTRALRLLHEAMPQIRHVTSFSDPVSRSDLRGNVIKVGHLGQVYQSLSMRLCGRTNPRSMLLAPDGCEISKRALDKLRRDEVGANYTYKMLRGYGLAPIARGEDGASYVRRVTQEGLEGGLLRRVRHPGNLAYVKAVGGRVERKRAMRAYRPALPYPKAA